jgi:hypothetical protein
VGSWQHEGSPVGLEMADHLVSVGSIAGSTCASVRWLGSAWHRSRGDELTLVCPLLRSWTVEALGLWFREDVRLRRCRNHGEGAMRATHHVCSIIVRADPMAWTGSEAGQLIFVAWF